MKPACHADEPAKMGTMATTKQESRSERIAVACTPTEKRAVRFVADAREMSESDVVRSMPMAEIVAEYARMREALGLAGAAA